MVSDTNRYRLGKVAEYRELELLIAFTEVSAATYYMIIMKVFIFVRNQWSSVLHSEERRARLNDDPFWTAINSQDTDFLLADNKIQRLTIDQIF